MKKIICLLILLIPFNFAGGQNVNLVPNSSFEVFLNCPTGLGQINKAPPWFSACNCWPGYYNSCANLNFPTWGVPYNEGCNYLPAKTGNAYAGIFAEQSPDNRRTYLEVKLTEPLVANKYYYTGFWVCMYDCLYLAMDMLGVYVSVDSVGCPQNQVPPAYLISAVPQVNNTPGNAITDTANWVLISGRFKAIGGEQFMVIGNFYPSSQTNWVWTQMQGIARAAYFIDDVFLYEDTTVTSHPELGRDKPSQITLSPNPARDEITLIVGTMIEGPATIKFYSSVQKE